MAGFVPSLAELGASYAALPADASLPNGAATAVAAVVLAPVYKELIADLDTPVSTFLKVRAHARESGGPNARHAFLLESVEGGERLARHSFVGAAPYELLTVGDCSGGLQGDPMSHLQAALARYRLLTCASVRLPAFTGGAVGYVAYDAVRHFEPRTEHVIAAQADTLQVPEAVFMLCDTMVVFDHVRHTIKIVAHVRMPLLPPASANGGGVAGLGAGSAPTAQSSPSTPSTALAPDVSSALAAAYADACARIDALHARLCQPVPAEDGLQALPIVTPPVGTGSAAAAAPAAAFDWERGSNVGGRAGYEAFVRNLKSHIVEGDIIQAVPSQRISRMFGEAGGRPPPSALDIYRQLRVVNPSPYMFYLELGEGFQIVGASPEMLVKVDAAGRVFTHPIAGTRRRGATPEEDDALAADLLADEKERAEHIMLVDLGRNDVGRVSAPGSVRVDSLMHVERYSHVMHIVSHVSGRLAAGRTAFDAFRSVFPAGTVSGAPKVRAIELVAGLEPHRRGVYAGAVGYVGYGGEMDTAIAIRTLVVRGGAVHLQAGAGIVFDSDPASEFDETIAKLRATMRAVDAAVEAKR